MTPTPSLRLRLERVHAKLHGSPRALAGASGLLAYRAAALVRKNIFATSDPDPENIAVMCDAFLWYACAQATAFRRMGWHVTLYYVERVDEFADDAGDRALYLDQARVAGVDVVALPRRSMRALPRHTLWLHRDVRRRRIATAIVHAHIDPRYGTLGLGLPVALVLHDPQTHSGDAASTFPLPVRLLSRLVELTSFCLILNSSLLLDQVRPVLRRLPIGVVPLGTTMAPAPSPVARERQLLVFGRLYEYKGVDSAIAALRLLPDDLSDVKLIVAGRGPLASLARGQHNVEVREEYIAESEVDDLIDGARLMLLPYKDATQSAVGMQAIARGVPCVVSRAGGLPELVPSSTPTLVVPPDDPKALAEAIVEHIDHSESLRTAIYDHAATHFAWPVVAQRWRSELQRLGLAECANR
jgi:glycosyltransferase involved in cell wall biosynthesis